MNDLFTRQSTCAPNFNQCKNANFPSYFCCPAGQRCISLAGNTTLLCCPEGSDCLKIQPVPCDISLQDGETNSDAVVKTTALGGTLSRCGRQCCPFGYSCDGTDCVMDKNQNPAPIQTKTAKPSPTSTAGSKTSATRSADATSTSTTTTTATNNPSTTSAASEPETTSSNGPPVAAIAGGVTAAAVVLIGSAIFMFIFLRRRRKQDEPPAGSPPKLSRSTSSFGNIISGPIMAENTAFRTDFARGVQSPNASDDAEEPASVTADLIGSSVSSPDSGSMLAVPAPTATRAGSGRQVAGGGGYGGLDAPTFDPSPFVDMPYVDHDNGLAPPHTPRQPREPSSVSINIFADPNITPDRTPESGTDRRYTSMTTFTQMLDRADLGGMARGESYLPYDPAGAPPVPRR